jgi:hypothetical protein
MQISQPIDLIECRVVEFEGACEVGLLCLVHHPLQRHPRQPILGIAAADIRVHAREPDLRNLAGWRILFVPKHGMEGAPLVVKGDGMAGALHDR